MKKIKLIRLPSNNAYKEFIIIGYMKDRPTRGEKFTVYSSMFTTGIVIEELNNNNEFRTKSFIYKIEYL